MENYTEDFAQQFASDNYSGICPQAWSAMADANRGHTTAYGDDPWTARAADAFRDLFETNLELFFVFNGTAANSLALASLCQSYHGVICADQAHVETDECGAPEFFSNGSKLLVAHSADGKLTPASIHELATKRQDIHFPKPRVVTITQSTETGRVYTVEEIQAISSACKAHGLSLHMDGARFANACASLGRTPAAIHELATRRTDIHFPKPRVATITQSTETGRVYTIQEIQAIATACKAHSLSLHMDGARFANACAGLNRTPAELTWKSGVDVLCFGGTKNGMAVGEAVLFFDRALAADFDYRCKQAGQLASKMRFLAAPWVGMLESGAWLTNAQHANQCARYFAQGVASIPNVNIVSPVEANTVFLQASEATLEGLRARGWKFYTFIGGAARIMFAWDSDLARIDALIHDLKESALQE